MSLIDVHGVLDRMTDVDDQFVKNSEVSMNWAPQPVEPHAHIYGWACYPMTCRAQAHGIEGNAHDR